MSEAVYWCYWDASALVRLVVDDEPGANDVRTYFQNNGPHCATFVSFVEALGVLKRKWNESLDSTEYQSAVEQLLIQMHGDPRAIEIDNTFLGDPTSFSEVSELTKLHVIDFADALQLFAIKKGKYSPLAADSKTRLISADRGLVAAARCLKIPTWRCNKDGPPNWI